MGDMIFHTRQMTGGTQAFVLKPDGVGIGFQTTSTGVYHEEHYSFDEYAKLQQLRPDIIPGLPANGNTIGRIVGETGGSGYPAAQSNPPLEPETKEEQSGWGSFLDGTQLALDVVGLIPGVGEVADGANALISLGRGDYAGAALSAAAMIPFAGWGATGAKLGKRGMDMADAANDVSKTKTAAEAAVKAGDEAAEQAGKHGDEAADAGKETAGKEKNRVKKQKPHKDCGKVSKYRNAPKKLGELNADHIPSGGALKRVAENVLAEQGIWQKLTRKQRESVLNAIYNNAPTITVPEDVHKEGRTYGSRNKPLIVDDAKDLKAAFEKDAQAIQRSMDTKDHGCSEAYADAVEQLREFDYDSYIKETISKHRYVKEVKE